MSFQLGGRAGRAGAHVLEQYTQKPPETAVLSLACVFPFRPFVWRRREKSAKFLLTTIDSLVCVSGKVCRFRKEPASEASGAAGLIVSARRFAMYV